MQAWLGEWDKWQKAVVILTHSVYSGSGHGLRPQLPKPKSQHHVLLACITWVSYFTFLCLTYLFVQWEWSEIGFLWRLISNSETESTIWHSKSIIETSAIIRITKNSLSWAEHRHRPKCFLRQSHPLCCLPTAY